jgi:hypothetical protein
MAALPVADDPNRSRLRAGNVNTGEEYEDDDEQSDSEYNFVEFERERGICSRGLSGRRVTFLYRLT